MQSHASTVARLAAIRQQHCAECFFYDPITERQGNPGEPEGRCRRMPPSVVSFILPQGPATQSVWTGVMATDWCGEFVSRGGAKQ